VKSFLTLTESDLREMLTEAAAEIPTDPYGASNRWPATTEQINKIARLAFQPGKKSKAVNACVCGLSYWDARTLLYRYELEGGY
jgi:hypothetical protein